MKEVTEDGYIMQVGDVIIGKHAFGVNKYTISRVTDKYAFSKDKEKSETKFKRLYQAFGFQPLPKQTWNTINYTLYSKTA